MLKFLMVFLFAPTIVFAAGHTVSIKSLSYDPKLIQIKVGDSVEWKNISLTEHSATTDEHAAPAAKFDTGLIAPKKTSKKIEFRKVGTFVYHCSVHGQTMSGKIEVQP